MATFIDPAELLAERRRPVSPKFQTAPYVVYAICDPVTASPVYVGQTQNIVLRFAVHIGFWRGPTRPKHYASISRWLATIGPSPVIDRSNEPRKPRKRGERRNRLIQPDPWIASHPELYKNLPLLPKIMIIDETQTAHESRIRETQWIFHYAEEGFRMLNRGVH